MPVIDKRPIFLIGFMGSGKSTLGKRLAKRTGRLFIDLDEQIEQAAGLPVPEYFKQHGEEKFREMERDTLQNLPVDGPVVVASGGGTPCFFDNMAWMNDHGITVYLKLPPATLLSRLIKGDLNTRPLLRDQTEEQLLLYIQTKLEEREHWYQQAGNIINGIGLTADNLIKYLTV